MPELDEVTLQHNTRELERVREEKQRGESGSNGRYPEDRAGGGGEDEGRIQGSTGTTERTEQRDSETPRPAKGHGKRVRPTDGSGIDATKSNGTDDTKTGKPVKRQFWQGKEQPPVQLLSEKESQDDEQLEHLMAVYMFLWSLPDYALEIFVKDHEEVQIWQLATAEAEELANAKLRLAKTDRDAAREVRSLLSMYDRMLNYTLSLPRMIATGRHIKEHEGFSFK